MNAPTISQSLRRDSSWSALSFVLIVFSGLLLNAGLAQSFGKTGLGLFNTCLSAVLILGQLGSLGINAAVAYHVPSAKSRGSDYQPILTNALWSTLATSSVVVVLLLIFVEGFVASDSSGYLTGLRLIYPAVFILPFNKVLTAYLNGLGDIKTAAIGNASRFILMLLFLFVAFAFDVSWKTVPAVISLAEFFLFVGLLWCSRSGLSHPKESKELKKERRKTILGFGIRSIPAVFLLDMNTRIDVLLLSVMKGAEVVGQYTVASTFSEGLFQMAMVTRLVVDPRVAGLNATGMSKELLRFLRRHVSLTYLVMIPVIVLSAFLYNPVVNLLFSKDNASGSFEVYLFLAAGVLVASGFIPLTNILNQLGDPLGQSLLLASLTVINIVGNVLLIPIMGAAGSALATAFAQAMLVPLLLIFVRSRRGFNWRLESQ
jgi:O-antigen/teichoic acid export membrane protein